MIQNKNRTKNKLSILKFPIHMRLSIFIFFFFYYIFYGVSADFLIYENNERPFASNKYYDLWINGIYNTKDFTYIDLEIKGNIAFEGMPLLNLEIGEPVKRRLSGPKFADLTNRKNDNIDFSKLSFTDPMDAGPGRLKINYIKIDKKSKRFIIRFYGHIADSLENINFAIKFGDLGTKPFDTEATNSTFKLPVNFSVHEEWEPKYKTKEDIFKVIDSSNDEIYGIYEYISGTGYEMADNMEFAIIRENQQYQLICFDNKEAPEWNMGDVKGVFFRTDNPKKYRGYFTQYNKEFLGEIYLIPNGDLLELRLAYNDKLFCRFARKYPEYNSYSINSEHAAWSGTGFALNDGYIVTNFHVADDASLIEIFGINGDFTQGHKAKVIGKDKVSDIAILRIEDEIVRNNWSAPDYSINYNMGDVGENIFALGYPLINTMGEEIKLTNGIISSRSGYEGDVTNYQISVPIQPGNSGGPMFNEDGEIIGIICAKHTEAENAGYAIKTSYLKNLIESVSSLNIVPSTNKLKGKPLKDQVKAIKNSVFLIKCFK